MTDDTDIMRPALWSVYFAAAGLQRAALPPGERPEHLANALDTLCGHVDRHGGARRRRALFELARAGLHRDTVRGDVVAKARALARQLHVHPSALNRAGTAEACSVLDTPPAGADAVAIKPGRVEARYLPRTHASSVEATFLVNKPVRALQRMMDPQCWEHHSDFFAKSERIDPETARPLPLDPGESWSGYLLEDFRVPIASFENILGIRFVATGERIHLDYWLYDSRRSTFVGQDLPGVLEVDDGFLHAVPVRDRPEWTTVTMKKTVVFRDLTPRHPSHNGIDHGQWLNYSAPAMLCLWMDETSQARLCCPD